MRRFPHPPLPTLHPGGWYGLAPPMTPPPMTGGDPWTPHAYYTATAPPFQDPCLYRELMKFVTPSGPRRSGEGTQEASQRIERILILHDGGILVQTTLLVAGFIIGPCGDSVRKIGDVSGAYVFSYTEFIKGKECRVFFIEGPMPCMLYAIDIMREAVNRYKDLAEGNFKGCQVDKIQILHGIDFHYHPPPRSLVPEAASLRTNRPEKPYRPNRSNWHNGSDRPNRSNWHNGSIWANRSNWDDGSNWHIGSNWANRSNWHDGCGRPNRSNWHNGCDKPYRPNRPNRSGRGRRGYRA